MWYRIAKHRGLWGLFMYRQDGTSMPRPLRSYATLPGAMHAARVRVEHHALQAKEAAQGRVRHSE